MKTSLIDILFNAAGGGVFGSVLHLATGFFETWRKKKDAEVEIMLLGAKADMEERAAAANAFAASQKASANSNVDVSKLPAWAGALYAVVNAFRDFTRPGLTWALLLVLGIVFFNTDAEVRASMADQLTFGAFTAIFWWFGSRYSRGTVK